MDQAAESQLATLLSALIERHAATPPIKRLRLRIRELGDNDRDEVQQFRQLQKACRELPEFAQGLKDAGFGDVATLDPRVPDPKTGALVQAFNRFVEARWEE
jgi:hypothetical protein